MNANFNTDSRPSQPDYEDHLHPTEARWFAVYTGYKREKRVVSMLDKKGITAYVPLQRLTRHYTRKTRQVEVPLINCYVFVFITKAQYVPVLETEYVLRFLKINRNLLAIPAAEIDLLKRIVGELTDIEVDVTTLHEGDPVEVIVGQLTGLQGTLIEKRGQHTLVIALKTLGYDLLMQVNPSHIRKLK
ncbi:MAG: hypothetical protein C7N36_08315 [Bacteroidetes bacterium]|nr:MAG: hypothetical protein C7N36_08315 [Bacteroidota bacterium]